MACKGAAVVKQCDFIVYDVLDVAASDCPFFLSASLVAGVTSPLLDFSGVEGYVYAEIIVFLARRLAQFVMARPPSPVLASVAARFAA